MCVHACVHACLLSTNVRFELRIESHLEEISGTVAVQVGHLPFVRKGHSLDVVVRIQRWARCRVHKSNLCKNQKPCALLMSDPILQMVFKAWLGHPAPGQRARASTCDMNGANPQNIKDSSYCIPDNGYHLGFFGCTGAGCCPPAWKMFRHHLTLCRWETKLHWWPWWCCPLQLCQIPLLSSCEKALLFLGTEPQLNGRW